MRKMAILLALVAVVGLVTAGAFAAKAGGGKGTPKADILKGKVVEVKKDAAGKITTVVVEGKKPGAKTPEKIDVTVDDKTKVTVDGKDATLADLKADMTVEVTPSTGTATEIKAKTAAAPAHGKGTAAPAPGTGGGGGE